MFVASKRTAGQSDEARHGDDPEPSRQVVAETTLWTYRRGIASSRANRSYPEVAPRSWGFTLKMNGSAANGPKTHTATAQRTLLRRIAAHRRPSVRMICTNAAIGATTHAAKRTSDARTATSPTPVPTPTSVRGARDQTTCTAITRSEVPPPRNCCPSSEPWSLCSRRSTSTSMRQETRSAQFHTGISLRRQWRHASRSTGAHSASSRVVAWTSLALLTRGRVLEEDLSSHRARHPEELHEERDRGDDQHRDPVLHDGRHDRGDRDPSHHEDAQGPHPGLRQHDRLRLSRWNAPPVTPPRLLGHTLIMLACT